MEKQKFQRCEDYGTTTKSTFFEKALGIVKRHLTGISHSSFASLGNEERKALQSHMIEVERARAMAIEHQRRNIFL